MSEVEIRRLILAKYLFLHGCSHSLCDDNVSRMLAIHHFDNAVEMVLKCIATKRQHRLGKYPRFDQLANKMKDIPLIDQVRGLHDVRNIVQHQGDIPDQETVIKYKGYTEEFFRLIIRREFKRLFDQLSLASLIQNKNLKDFIRKAEKEFEKGNFKKCIASCDKALIKATFELSDIFGKAGMLTGYFGAGDELKEVISKDYAEKFKGKDFYMIAKDLHKALLQLGQASTSMQFLNDYRTSFLEFRNIVINLDNIPKKELKEKAQFSLNFAINLFLRWQTEGVINPKSTGEFG